MDFRHTSFSKSLGLKLPLIVAPMAGGPSTPALVAASSEAGALGSMGAAYMTAAEITAFADEVRAKTSKPFGINLFIPSAAVLLTNEQIEKAVAVSSVFRRDLRLPNPSAIQEPFQQDFDQQLEAVLRVRPRVLSFVFGNLRAEYIRAAKDAGIILIGTAASLEEACELEAAGVDAVTLQGFEAGGHRGIFSATADDPRVLTFDLLEQCRASVRVPLIPAGGMMNAADIKKAILGGADAVQMGTAFLCTTEAGTSIPYRRALMIQPRVTKTTRVFSGRLARGIVNRFVREMEPMAEILPWPAQNKFTRDLRKASEASGSYEFLSLWSGTGIGDLWTGSAAELIEHLYADLVK